MPDWTHGIKETRVETEPETAINDDSTDGVPPRSSKAAAVNDDENAALAYTGTDKRSPESDGQSDYQRPMSVTSDQWSNYDPGLRGNNRSADKDVGSQNLVSDTQCCDEDMPYYVNASALAADAAADADNLTFLVPELSLEP